MRLKLISILLIVFSVEANAQSGIVTFNFENGYHNDTSLFEADTTGLWQIGSPDKIYLDSSVSLPFAIITDTINPYPINSNSLFTIKYPGCFYFEASLKYQTDSCNDGLLVEMFFPDDSLWLNMIEYIDTPWWIISPYHSYNVTSVQDICTLSNGETAISGTGSQILKIDFHTTFVRASNPFEKIKFRFRFISDSISNSSEGFLIDDLKISYYSCPGSIEENSFSPFKIFPNPVSSIINIESNFSIKNQIKITNQLGEIVQQEFLKNNAIDVSNLVQGIYFVLIQGQNGWHAQKFIKL